MKKITILLLLVMIFSCKKENDPYAMYGILNSEFDDSCQLLKVQISETLLHNKLIDNQTAKTYDSLTTQYLKYLENTYSELMSSPKIEKDGTYDGEFSKTEYINDLFFDHGEYSEEGMEFVSTMEHYRTEILELIQDKHLEERVYLTLNTAYIQDHKGKRVEYLNYSYKDKPLIAVLTYMKNQEKSILEFENDFLKNRILNE